MLFTYAELPSGKSNLTVLREPGGCGLVRTPPLLWACRPSLLTALSKLQREADDPCKDRTPRPHLPAS